MKRAVLVIVVVVAASVAAIMVIDGGNDESAPAAAGTTMPATSTTQTSPTSSSPTASALSAAEILREANFLLVDPSDERVAIVAGSMAATGDTVWVPFLVDMLQFFGRGDSLVVLGQSLEELTGVPVPADGVAAFATFGGWMYDEEPVPVDGYVEWKSRLFGLVDAAFTPLIAQIDDPVLASQMQWGGVRRGGIPELNDAATISIEAADYMTSDELTFGVSLGGQVRSYPHRILDHHELANDTLGGEPVALANCTLCRTGVLYSRIVGGQVLDFQTSGFLRNSNKVMVDIQTESLWNQLTGEAIAGPLQGTVLDRFPITVTTYGEWIAEHPDSDVVAVPGRGRDLPDGIVDAGYSYEPGDAYADYYASERLWFPTGEIPGVFDAKELVATVDVGGAQLAIGIEELAAAGPQILEVDGRTVVAVETAGGARVYDALDLDLATVDLAGAEAGDEALIVGGVSLPRLQSGHSFWFAWFANFPETNTWPVG